MSPARIRICSGDTEPGLPLDIASTVLSAIGSAYPGAAVIPTGGPGFTLSIPDEDRNLEQGEEDGPADITDARLVGFDEGGAHFTVPQEANMQLAEWACTVLDATDGAVNYVEQQATHPDVGTFVVIACRSEGQTPHQLRQAAEERADRLQGQVDDARRRLAEVLGITPATGTRPPDLDDLVNEVALLVTGSRSL